MGNMTFVLDFNTPVHTVVSRRPTKDHPNAEILVSGGGGSAKTGFLNKLGLLSASYNDELQPSLTLLQEKDIGSTLVTDLILSRNEQWICGLTGGREIIIYTWRNLDFPVEALRFEIPKSEFPERPDPENLNGVNTACFVDGDRFLVCGQECGVISVWRLFSENDVLLRNPECVLQYCPVPEPITWISCAPQSNSMAISYRTGVIKIVALPDLTELRETKTHVFTVLAQGPLTIGDKYVDHTTSVARRRKKAGVPLAGRWKCLHASFSPNGKYLIVLESSDSGAACISKWCYSTVSSTDAKKQGNKTSAIETVEWSSQSSDYFDSAFVGLPSSDEPDDSLGSWVLISSELASKGTLGCMAVAFADDNNVYDVDLVATGAGDGKISLFDGLTMKKHWTLSPVPNGHFIQGLAFVHSQELLVGVSADGTISCSSAQVVQQKSGSMLGSCLRIALFLVVLQLLAWFVLVSLAEEQAKRSLP